MTQKVKKEPFLAVAFVSPVLWQGVNVRISNYSQLNSASFSCFLGNRTVVSNPVSYECHE